jgi:hypothetical protein
MDATDQIRRRFPSHRRIIFGNIFHEAMRTETSEHVARDLNERTAWREKIA